MDLVCDHRLVRRQHAVQCDSPDAGVEDRCKEQRHGTAADAAGVDPAWIDVDTRGQKVNPSGDVPGTHPHQGLTYEERRHGVIVVSEVSVELTAVDIGIDARFPQTSSIDRQHDHAGFREHLRIGGGTDLPVAMDQEQPRPPGSLSCWHI